MVKSIDVINVGFGDSAIISGYNHEEYKVLVDCGSKHRYNQQIIDLVNNELSNKKSFGILSHFHDDHYKFIPKLNKLFDEFYLPNYLNTQTISIQLKTYLLIRNNSSIKKASEAMVRLDKITKCLKPNGKLIFVSSKKQKPTTILDDFRVLWPVKEDNTDDSEVNEQLNSFFKKEDLIQIDNFSEEFVTHFENNSEIINETQFMIPGAKIFNTKERIQDLSSKIIPIEYKTDSETLSIDNSTKNGPLDISTKTDFIDWTIKDGILKNQHRYCLVFDRIKDDSFPFLFLGDIDKDLLQNKIIANISSNHYKYLKVVHHGTEAYFLPNLPPAENLIISNKSWGKRLSWQIYEQYPLHYKNTRFICTNNDGCNYCKTKGTCNNSIICGFGNRLSNSFQ